jgi:hypothetical protein
LRGVFDATDEGDPAEGAKATTLKWYILSGQKAVGPVSLSDLKKMAKAGNLRPYARVRLGEIGDWVLADTIEGLGFGAESGGRQVADETGNGSKRRYPMLHKYLDISAVVLDICTGIAFIALIAFLLVGLFQAAQIKEGAGYIAALFVCLVVISVAVLALGYLAGRASIEFMRVVIDVEANTREIAGRLKTPNDAKG